MRKSARKEGESLMSLRLSLNYSTFPSNLNVNAEMSVLLFRFVLSFFLFFFLSGFFVADTQFCVRLCSSIGPSVPDD